MNSRANEVVLSEPLENKLNALQYLPVNLFGAVMGLSGLSLAWRLAATVFGLPTLIGEFIGLIAVLAFVILSVSYVYKFIQFPDKVLAEFHNPIIGNFFGTITIAILLISSVIHPYCQGLSEWLWIVGAITTVVLAYIIVKRLLVKKQDIMTTTPTLLIPGVGTLDIAVAGGTMPFDWAKEVNLFTFAAGSFVALVFFTIIFYRLMHHDSMPERLTPSLMIMIAPFAVGFLSYVNIVQKIDMFASILFYFGLFLFIILFRQVFNKQLPFMITWWAVSFPMAALSNAAIKYADYTGSWPLQAVAIVILAILTAVIAYIFVRTLNLLFTGKLLRA